MNPEEQPPQPQLPPIAPQEKRFISVATDMLEAEYVKFQNPILPLVERVRAGHRFLSTTAALLKLAARTNPERSEEHTADAKQVQMFISGYRAPRTRSQLVRQADDIQVYRLYVGGATDAFSDVLPQDLKLGRDLTADQQHESYYNNVLSLVVADYMVKMAELGYIEKQPSKLGFSFRHITEPVDLKIQADKRERQQAMMHDETQDDEDTEDDSMEDDSDGA